MFTDITLKNRRNRLSPCTAAERRLNKTASVADDPIVTHKSHARKAQR